MKPLIYYFYANGDWQQNELPEEISEMRIGTNPDMCEIQLDSSAADEVQVVLKRFGEVWYFFESGKKAMMRINGIPKRQTELQPKTSMVLKVGKFVIIFSTKSDKIMLHKTSGFKERFRPPEEGEFSLKGSDQEISYPQDTVCLIGSNPLCEFHIHTQKQFCGYISFHKKNYYFKSFIKNFEILVSKNGLNVKDHIIMKPNDNLVLGTDKITFNAPGKITPLPLDSDEESLALIQIGDDGETVNTYKLPEAGSSLFVGRSQAVSHIVIEGSTKISRKHGQIVVFENYIQLVDVGATNGLFVNGEKITNVYINPGDLFRMADLKFVLGFA